MILRRYKLKNNNSKPTNSENSTIFKVVKFLIRPFDISVSFETRRGYDEKEHLE